jgi:hypothetical protein
MSCAGCRKKQTYGYAIEMAQRMANVERLPYVVITRNEKYDFITLDEALRTKQRIFKVLPVN